MSGLFWSAAVLAVGALALAPGRAVGDDGGLKADLARVAGRRVLFAHQSVGESLVAAMRRLAAASGTALPITEVGPAAPLGPGLSHFLVPENGDPRRKLAGFEKALADRAAAPPDVAILKLCFVDFEAGTDAAALFAAYRSTVDGLQQRFPGTRILHVTTPLTIVQGGARALVKRLLGQAPWGAAENARREEFNQLMRQAYAGPTLFDLARLEATRADGSTVSFGFQGREVLALDPAASADVGHLTEPAQDRIARALLAQLARLP